MKKRSSSEKSQKRTAKTKGTLERITIGLDLGDKTSSRSQPGRTLPRKR